MRDMDSGLDSGRVTHAPDTIEAYPRLLHTRACDIEAAPH